VVLHHVYILRLRYAGVQETSDDRADRSQACVLLTVRGNETAYHLNLALHTEDGSLVWVVVSAMVQTDVVVQFQSVEWMVGRTILDKALNTIISLQHSVFPSQASTFTKPVRRQPVFSRSSFIMRLFTRWPGLG